VRVLLGADLRTAVADAGAAIGVDVPALHRAHGKGPLTRVVGRLFSPACYIDGAFPSLLYMAYAYADNPEEALIGNTNTGGENCHRCVHAAAALCTLCCGRRPGSAAAFGAAGEVGRRTGAGSECPGDGRASIEGAATALCHLEAPAAQAATSAAAPPASPPHSASSRFLVPRLQRLGARRVDGLNQGNGLLAAPVGRGAASLFRDSCGGSRIRGRSPVCRAATPSGCRRRGGQRGQRPGWCTAHGHWGNG
jgi:hypothetical protein